MTKYIWITVSVIAVVLILAWKQAPKEPPVVRTPEPTSQEEPAPVATSTPTFIVSKSGNLKISEPAKDGLASSPLLVKGEAKLKDNSFELRLKDSTGKEIVKKTVKYTAPKAGEFSSFGELMLFDQPKTDAGILEAGTGDDLVQIPVKFK